MLLLRTKGYRLLVRAYIVRGGEIDIIARRGSAVAFVKVKARPTLEEALIAITPTKQTHVHRRASLAQRKSMDDTLQPARRSHGDRTVACAAPPRRRVELRLD
jgi:Holliday junction resolvase-like predicted endonuclease